MLDELYKRGITDILVEGGGEVNASFLRNGLIQKFLVYVAPKVLGGRNSITPFTGDDVETIDAAMLLQFEKLIKSVKICALLHIQRRMKINES